MKSKVKHKIFDHLGLKFLSLVIAFVMWFIVMNIEDSTITRTIENIPVKMINEDSILENGRVFDITDGDTVDVVVKGPRSIVENLEVDNFNATADLSHLSVTNSTTIKVSVNGSIYVKNAKQLTVTPVNQYVTLSIEKEIEKSIPVKVITTGSVPEGYAVGSAVPTPNMITVKGPASVLANIVEARAVADVNSSTTDIETKVSVGCIDGYGAAVAKDNISLSEDTVDVTIPIYKTKKVPVHVMIAGSPKEGYAVREVNFEPDSILVAGPDANLAKFDSLDIRDVVVTDSTDKIEKNINVLEYLTDGIITADPNNNEIAISVAIEQLEEKELNLNTSSINISDKTSEYEYEIVSASVTKVKVVGFHDKLEELTAQKLNPRISVKELRPGTHTLQITFNDSDAYTIKGAYTVTLEVKQKE